MNVTKLPYRSGVFDAAVCIAVLHHISSLERRQAVVHECMRCVRKGGKALFYAWAFEQEKPTVDQGSDAVSGHRFDAQDVLVPFHKRLDRPGADDAQDEPLPAHASMDPEKKAVVLQRYCHVYASGEVSSLFAPLVDAGQRRSEPGR